MHIKEYAYKLLDCTRYLIYESPDGDKHIALHAILYCLIAFINVKLQIIATTRSRKTQIFNLNLVSYEHSSIVEYLMSIPRTTYFNWMQISMQMTFPSDHVYSTSVTFYLSINNQLLSNKSLDNTVSTRLSYYMYLIWKLNGFYPLAIVSCDALETIPIMFVYIYVYVMPNMASSNSKLF